MKVQDKQAEIKLAEGEFRQGSWQDSDRQRQARRKQLELLQPTPLQNQLILDAGRGPGTYGTILAQQGNEVIGCDISSQATQVARARASKKNVRFVPIVGHLERLPLKNNTFDICFCGYTLHHFPDIRPVSMELARILKPGGRIFLAEPNGSNPVPMLSGAVENLLRGWLVALALDTPNEVNHKATVYTRVLEQQGLIDIEVSSCLPGGLPPLPARPQKWGMSSLGLLVIHILVRLRRLSFIIAEKILPRTLNGTDLLITGTKAERDT